MPARRSWPGTASSVSIRTSLNSSPPRRPIPCLGSTATDGVEAGVDEDRARRSGARPGTRPPAPPSTRRAARRRRWPCSGASRPSSRWNSAGGPIIRAHSSGCSFTVAPSLAARAAGSEAGRGSAAVAMRARPYARGRLPPPWRRELFAPGPARRPGGARHRRRLGPRPRDRGRAGRVRRARGGLRPARSSRSRRPSRCARTAAARRATCDIREEEQVDALVDGVLERHGRIDLLVNNAGGQYLTPAEDITPEGLPHRDPPERGGHLADDPRGGDQGDDPGARAARS